MKNNLKQEGGQILIVLILILIAGLTAGLMIVQRSLTGLTTSTQGEQSTRAFAAAESGIEKAIKIGPTGTFPSSGFSLGNESSVTVTKSDVLPSATQALEYPPIDKGLIAHFWLANPVTYAQVYPPSSIVNVYFGCKEPSTDCEEDPADPPAIEIALITWDGSKYVQEPSQFADVLGGRNLGNCNAPNTSNPAPINTSNSTTSTPADRYFRCRVAVNIPARIPVIIRLRILASADKHPVAVQPTAGNSLPQQAVIYTSVGTAGQAQKTLQHFRLNYVVPPYFNYAIFSIGDIDKD